MDVFLIVKILNHFKVDLIFLNVFNLKVGDKPAAVCCCAVN